jgi:hypothetical protein
MSREEKVWMTVPQVEGWNENENTNEKCGDGIILCRYRSIKNYSLPPLLIKYFIFVKPP